MQRFQVVYTCYLPAGRSIKVKNCDRVLENAAQSLGQHFQARGQFFTIQDQPHAEKKTRLFFIFPAVNWC